MHFPSLKTSTSLAFSLVFVLLRKLVRVGFNLVLQFQCVYTNVYFFHVLKVKTFLKLTWRSTAFTVVLHFIMQCRFPDEVAKV